MLKTIALQPRIGAIFKIYLCCINLLIDIQAWVLSFTAWVRSVTLSLLMIVLTFVLVVSGLTNINYAMYWLLVPWHQTSEISLPHIG